MDSETIQLREQNNYLRQLIAFQDQNTGSVFQQLSENIDDVFWLRTDSEMIYINPAFEKVWGIPCSEIYQNPQIFTDSIHPADRAKVAEILHSDSFKKTGLFEYEYRIIRPDKQIRWLHAKSLPIANNKGEIFRRVGMAHDITEQKKSQEETGLLAEMLNVAPNSITIHDQAGTFLFANQKTFEIHGYNHEEFMALNLRALDVPESAELIAKRIKAIQENGQAMFEVKHFRKDGSTIPLEVYVKMVDWKGTPALMSIATDISIREIAELELKNSEEKFRTLVENANDIIYQLSPEGIFTYLSPNLTEILGYLPCEFVGEYIQQFAHPDDLHLCIDFLNKVLTTGEKQSSVEYRVKHKNGTWRWHNSNGAPLKDKQGIAVSYLGVSRDITEQKKSIAALQQIEWMLTEKKVKNENSTPEYGDLSELNTNGIILSLVGKEQLTQIASEYLDLLETSSAIYEKNGDYALGLFTSSWCQTMDTASRKLCNTESNQEALNCGKWLCHESCWRDASLNAIESGKPTDVKCKGGLRLFAVPIHANGEVIGAINFGYGNPPTAGDELQSLSDLYQVPIEELRKKSQEYQIRPQYIIDFAKRRILLSAKYLGNLIEGKQAELLLQEKSEQISRQNEVLNQTNQELIKEKEKAQENEEKYRALYINAPLSYQSLDENGCFQDINPMWLKTLGYERDEVIGKWFGDFLHPDYVEHFKTNFPAFKKRGYVSDVQFKMKKKDGKYIHVSYEGCIGYSADGLFKQTYCVFKDITEQKIAQDELFIAKAEIEKSEEKFRTIFDRSLVSIIVADDQGNYLSANSAACNLFGYSLDEMLKMNIRDLKTVYKPGAEERYREYLHKGEENGEFDFITKNGEYKIAFYQAVRISNNFNLSMLVDITKQKETEDDLLKAKEKAEESQQKFKAIADTSPLVIYISKGINQVAEYINPSFIKLFGYQYEEVSEVALWWPLAYPDKAYQKQVSEQWNSLVATAIQNKSDIEPMEVIVACKDGTKKNILWGFVSTGDENWAFGMDLTAYRKTEQELIVAKERAEASEQHFKSLIENAPDGVVVIDAGGKFIYGSPNSARHFGYHENEIIGHSGDEYTHPDDLPLVSKTFESIINDPLQKPTVSYRFKRKNGEYRWIETTFTNLLADKAINGIILNFTDITERRQVFEELIIAKEKAEESDRLKTAFLQNMSHEIRTPMNAIMGFSELLLKNFENKEKLQNFVSIINQRCSDLLVIINDILDIAKIESGQLQLNDEKVNIRKLLLELEAIFNEQKLKLNKTNITIVFNNLQQTANLYLITDRSRLIQIFNNLISNALKFTFQGKIEFGFSINNEQQIEFYVSDTGIGIPKDKHEVIFERFIQLNHGTSRLIGGNGLGLAITKGLVKILGGRIWLQSEIDKGTTFYFTIKTVIDSNINYLIGSKIEDIKVDCFKGKTILVVEDDEYNKALIKEILDNQGFGFIFADNGSDSVQMCLTTPIDLVLMDIGLPDISGYEAIKQILLNNPNMKIIAQTAYASPTDKNMTMQAGCIDYISKPIKTTGLIEIIKRHL